MDRILAIAGNTLRETNRNRVMYVLLLFAILMILGSVTMGKLALRDQAILIKDLGLAAISLFGMIIAVYLGVTVVHRELEQKTVYFIIPKPLHRTEFLLGKFLGMCATLAIQIVVMSSVFFMVLLAYGAAAVLSMIPITPGGLGFVEAGLTGALTLAGVPATDALLATLAYRLVSYWMPIPLGLSAYLLFRRRYGVPPSEREALALDDPDPAGPD